MTRNVRPAWIEVSVDGRSDIATGPRSRTGQMSITASIRENGSILKLLDIDFIASRDGQTVRVIIEDHRTHKPVFEEVFNQ